MIEVLLWLCVVGFCSSVAFVAGEANAIRRRR